MVSLPHFQRRKPRPREVKWLLSDREALFHLGLSNTKPKVLATMLFSFSTRGIFSYLGILGTTQTFPKQVPLGILSWLCTLFLLQCKSLPPCSQVLNLSPRLTSGARGQLIRRPQISSLLRQCPISKASWPAIPSDALILIFLVHSLVPHFSLVLTGTPTDVLLHLSKSCLQSQEMVPCAPPKRYLLFCSSCNT